MTTGIANHSLSVLAVGLGVLADVTGSATLAWRFRAERHQPGHSQAAEARAAAVVAGALVLLSAVITIQAVTALALGSRPGTSNVVTDTTGANCFADVTDARLLVAAPDAGAGPEIVTWPLLLLAWVWARWPLSLAA